MNDELEDLWRRYLILMRETRSGIVLQRQHASLEEVRRAIERLEQDMRERLERLSRTAKADNQRASQQQIDEVESGDVLTSIDSQASPFQCSSRILQVITELRIMAHMSGAASFPHLSQERMLQHALEAGEEGLYDLFLYGFEEAPEQDNSEHETRRVRPRMEIERGVLRLRGGAGPRRDPAARVPPVHVPTPEILAQIGRMLWAVERFNIPNVPRDLPAVFRAQGRPGLTRYLRTIQGFLRRHGHEPIDMPRTRFPFEISSVFPAQVPSPTGLYSMTLQSNFYNVRNPQDLQGPLLNRLPFAEQPMYGRMFNEGVRAVLARVISDVREVYADRPQLEERLGMRVRIWAVAHGYVEANDHRDGENTNNAFLERHFHLTSTGSTDDMPHIHLRDVPPQAYVDRWLGDIERAATSQPSNISFVLTKVTVHVLPLQHITRYEGGCVGHRRNRAGHINGGIVAISPLSRNNNCFFGAISHFYPQLKEDARVLRRNHGFSQGSMISLDEATLFARQQLINLKIFNEQGEEIAQYLSVPELVEEHCALLLCANEHYYIIRHMDRKLFKCPDCGRQYFGNHTCTPERCLNYQRYKSKSSLVKACTAKQSACGDERHVFYYDLETFPNGPDRLHEPYAAGWLDETTGGSVKKAFGRDCMDAMMEELLALPSRRLVIAYFGSRFDHHFLLRWLTKNNVPVYDMVMSGNKLLKFEFGAQKHAIWDLGQFVMSPLKNACIDFQIEARKSMFPHRYLNSWEKVLEPQPWPECEWWDLKKDANGEEENPPEPQEVWNTEDQVMPYLHLDILTMQQLFQKVDAVFREYFENVDCGRFMTLSHMTYHLWQRTIGGLEIERPVSAHQYDYIRGALYGGRVTVSKRFFCSSQSIDTPHEELIDYLENLDINSLYPFEMTKLFPVGPSRWLAPHMITSINQGEWDLWPPFAVAKVMYIPPPYLLHPILPRRGDQDQLIWDLCPSSGMYTLPELRQAHAAGYKIIVESALVWDQGAYIFRDYILKCMELKELGGRKDANGDEFNAALKIIAKLLANGLYGKTVQGLHTGSTILTSSHQELLNFVEAHLINNLFNFGDAVFASGNTPREHAITRSSKPIQLGAYVTALSRVEMMDLILRTNPNLFKAAQSKETWETYGEEVVRKNFYYMDTDSLHLHTRDAEAIRDRCGDALGELKNEFHKIGDGRVVLGVFVSPKFYKEHAIGKRKRLNVMHAKGIPNKLIPEDAFDFLIHDDSGYEKKVKFDSLQNYSSRQYQGEPFGIITKTYERTVGKSAFTARTTRDNTTYPLGWGGEIVDREEMENPSQQSMGAEENWLDALCEEA